MLLGRQSDGKEICCIEEFSAAICQALESAIV